MSFIDLLPGIIWAGFLGLAIGNFATNPVYRLPRRESLFAKDPYCGDCNAPLKPRDLFPVFSWLSTRGHCRYCGANIPGAYAVTEALIGILFIMCYLKFDFSEQFILIAFGLTAFVMLAMMLYIDNFFSDRTWVACALLGMLYRTLQEGTLYGFFVSAFAGIVAGALAWKISGKPMARDVAAFPIYMKLLTLAGVWLAFPNLILLAAIALLASVFKQHKTWLVEYVIIASAMVLTLYSNLVF